MVRITNFKTPLPFFSLLFVAICSALLFTPAVHAINGYASGWCPFSDGVEGGIYYFGSSHLEVVKQCEARGTRVTENGYIQKTELLDVVAQGTTIYVPKRTGYENLGLGRSWSYRMTSISPSGEVTIVESSIGALERFCLPGYVISSGCVPTSCDEGESWDYESSTCAPDAKQPQMCPSGGTNPISVITGNKHAMEADIVINSNGIEFRRFYNSSLLYGEDTAFGGYWRHEYETRITLNLQENLASVQDARGVVRRFIKTGNNWVGEANSTGSLLEFVDGAGERTGWQYTSETNNVETYDSFGVIQSVQTIEDNNLSFHYDLAVEEGGDGYGYTLDKVSNSFGKEIHFKYVDFILVEMMDSDGQSYLYEYDPVGRLSAVTYPDNTPGNATDNPKRIYHYEDANFPQALTGISDENGNRFATWSYDSEGRATSSEHANGVEHVSLDYTHIDDVSDPRVTVTNELGKDTTYHYTTIHGVRKVTQVEGHASDNCAAANQSYTYDANGFKDEVTDWEGHVTDYDHDARGLEVQRIEAKGTAQERTITTEWHTDFRLPTKITEPDRVIEFSYDTQGLLLERKETPVP